jgi:hypothetical protein
VSVLSIPADADRTERRDVWLLRVVVVLAAVALPLAVGVHAQGWDAPGAAWAPGVAVLAPVAAPGGGRGAVCDTDAHCAALAAREDQRAGRVPRPAFGPAADGGTAVSCPDGWEVTGSSVFDSRCVPSTDLIDA